MRKRYIPRPTGDELKRNGMARAAAAVPSWSRQAKYTIDHVLAPQSWETKEQITSEHLTALIGLPRGKVGLHRNNAVGAAFSAAARRGTIICIGYEKSTRSVSHSHVMAVWVGAEPRRRTIPRP